MEYRLIKFETKGTVGMITLNQPEKRNALSQQMLKELSGLLDALKEDQTAKTIVIKGAGKVFSSGHDISEMLGRGMADYKDIFDICSGVMMKLQSLRQPVIAQVHGIATAAGCQLVAACDLAVAEEGTLFGTPGVRLGLFCSTPAIPLVRAVGRKRALEMLFTGRMISAREAEQYGLVNRVVPADQLETETLAMAEKIAEASLLTLGIGKRAFYTQINLADSQAYAFGNEVMVANLYAEDSVEGLKAFIEKRKPEWKNK